MSTRTLKRYQENAVDELVMKTKLLLGKHLDKRTIVFQSPTGSGKTFMMSQYIEQCIEEMKDQDLCFLWLSPGKGALHEQSYKSLKKEFSGFPVAYLLEEEFIGSRRTIDKNEVVVGNWEKLSNKDRETNEWKSRLMKDKETVNFRELVENTRNAGVKIVLIIDESHSRANEATRAFELRDNIIKPDLTIEMSATPILKEGQYQEKVSVASNDVIDEGMIKKEILINENIDKIQDSENTSQQVILESAYNKRNVLKSLYEKEGVDINPLVLIQIPDKDAGDDKKEFVEKFLAEKDITRDNGKLAVWLTDDKVNQEAELITKNNDKVEFLIFKKAVDTGWDCPRAQILVKFRETQSLVFEIQTVGRILRMPEATHYRNEELNKAFVFTNVKSISIKNEEYNPNIIKSIMVRRDTKLYKSLKLRSYYRPRVDYGDITANFSPVLEKVFCNYFDIKVGATEKSDITKNLKKIQGKIDIKNLDGHDEIILNKKISTELFDFLPQEEIESEDFLQMNLSADDKERAFENILKKNLGKFAPKRSLSPVKQSLYKWFKKYAGISPLEGGIIYVQNIVLNNFETFARLFDEAVRAYEPEKQEEIAEKIKEVEEWNDEWEISETRNFNPYTHKPYGFKLSLYKHNQDKKAYLTLNNLEEDFVKFLDNNKEKIEWWWQNGAEHMNLNFGIKYNGGSTFQPDFLVMFKDGRLGIFDTKASGDREDANKLKAEALQKYIAEENKKKSKNLFGGLVIKNGDHFMVNSDKKYESFKKTDSNLVKEGGKKYGSEESGWKYFQF